MLGPIERQLDVSRRRGRLGAHGEPARRRGAHPGPRPARRPAGRAAGDPRHPDRGRASARCSRSSSTSLPLLLVGRVLQGASYGLFPLSISVLRRELPARPAERGDVGGQQHAGRRRRGRAGRHRAAHRRRRRLPRGRSGSGSASPCISLALAAWVLPHRPPVGSGRVDWWGALVLGAGLVLSCCRSRRARPGAGPPPGSWAAWRRSAVVLTGWVLLQRRTAEPLVRPGDAGRPAHDRPQRRRPDDRCRAVRLVPRRPPVRAGAARASPATGSAPRVLEASVIYLLPGGIAGHRAGAVRRAAGDAARSAADPARRRASPGSPGSCCWRSSGASPGRSWSRGVLTQVAVTVAYAALPALVVQAVQRGGDRRGQRGQLDRALGRARRSAARSPSR